MAGILFKNAIIDGALDNPALLDDFLNKLKKITEHYQTYVLPRLMKKVKGRPSLQEFARIDSGYLLNLLKESTQDEMSEELEEKKENKQELRKTLEKLLKNLDVNKSRLASYYGYIAMDGDKMGEWLAGKRLPSFQHVIHPQIVDQIKRSTDERSQKIARVLSEQRRITPSIHSMISAVQNQFAVTVARQVVEEQNWGKLVYAGGDDVLAMVPVAVALNLVHHLRLAFSGFADRLKGSTGWVETNNDWQMRFGHTATASLGLVIAHHTTPMRWVISRAQAMEKAAKQSGRNALGLALLKRSGELVETVIPFSTDDGKDVIKDVLNPLYQWIAGDVISRDFVFVLRSEQSGFSDAHWDMFLVEIRRVFERKIKNKDKKTYLIQQFVEWSEALTALFETIQKRHKKQASNKSKQKYPTEIIDTLLNTFAIIEFMARES